MFLVSASNPTASALGTQISMSAIAVAFIQWLKNSPLMPYMHAGSDWANRIVSFTLAAASAVGIHMAWAPGAQAGDYTITVTGLTLAGVSLMAWGIVKSMVFNELIYRGTVKSVALPPGVQVVGGQAGAPQAQEVKAMKN
jgi:hypothetical protein